MNEIDLNDIDRWSDLLEKLVSCTEEELLTLLNHEALLYRRKHFVVRLHMRYSKLRMRRERKLLLQGRRIL
jgi:hypothetical protein